MLDNSMSRRKFVAGAAAAGAAGAVAAAGLATAQAAESEAAESEAADDTAEEAELVDGMKVVATDPYNQPTGIDLQTVVKESNGITISARQIRDLQNDVPDWALYPGDLTADSTEKTDVLIIGCGFAGSIAAVTAAEKGAKVTVIEKASQPSGRGAHITSFGSKVVQQALADGWITEDQMDYAQIVRNWIRWSQGRLNENMLWMFARKSGACMDWLQEKMEEQGLHATLWCDFFKGPDYTEWPITHFFYDDTTDFVYLNGQSHGLGMDVLLPALKTYGESLGVTYVFDTTCERLLRPEADGPVTGAIVTPDEGKTHIEYDANAVIIASGDYSGDTEMMKTYDPWALEAADVRMYIPQWVNTGDLQKEALWIGAAMQTNNSHACVMHLEGGAQSYNFLHVNGEGKRFMNEDVNTQSKSSGKAFYGDHRAFTIYDSNGLSEIAKQCEEGIAGGISVGQQYRRFGTPFDMDVENKLLQAKIEDGNIQIADTLEELAEKIDVPVDNFVAAVNRYNELVDKGSDDDYGKRAEIMVKIEQPPFYAGKLVASLLSASGGLHSDEYGHVLDADSNPIPNLYCAGTAQGDFHGSGDYPTICPGVNHGRCLTFGRLTGLQAAGGSVDEVADYDIKMPAGGGLKENTL